MTTEPPRRSRARLAVIGAGFLLAQVAAVAVYRWVENARERDDAPRFRSEHVDAPASPITMSRPDGAPMSLESLRGRRVLLHFWATWCAPCRVELPKLLELGRSLGNDGRISVIAVAMDDDWEAVRQFFNGTIPPEVVRVEANEAERLYGVSTLPDTYLIDASGHLRLRFRGARDWRNPIARETLTKIGYVARQGSPQ